MVGLSKDPEGERIFSAHAEALHGTTALGRLINDDLISTKRKLKQMENVTEEYRVLIVKPSPKLRKSLNSVSGDRLNNLYMAVA